ncbi:MAG TPA: AAA family ATPase, partial [Myxococcaceae bacterium]|nr:AAA family ATPase [Myxococcaceae bacterium]
MRIDRIHIDGFGRLAGMRLALGPGLNVLHGENEAGKSTLLAFIRAVLFRFRGRTDPLRFAPESGVFGGELHLSTDRGPLVVRRLGARRVEGDVTLRGAHGAPEPPSRLQEALRGVSEELFCQVFAFSLTELAEFRALAEETSVSEALFAAGMQGARRLPDVAQALRRSSDEIWKSGPGGKKPLNTVLAELERVRRDLEALGRPPERYFELVDVAARLEREVGETERRIGEAREERERLGRLERVASELAELERIRVALQSYPEDLQDFPADGVARLEAGEEWLRRCAARMAELSAGADQSALALKECEASSLPAGAIASLASALEGFDRASSLRDGLAGRRAEIEAERSEAGRQLRGLGLPVDAEALAAIDLGSAARAQLASLRTRLGEVERAADSLQAELRQQQLSVAQLRAEVARRASERDALSSAPLADLRRRAFALRDIPLLEADCRRRQEETEALKRELAELASDAEPAPR